jgi:hypothetical protein
MARARMMPSLCWKRYVQRVWTREVVSLEMSRGVISEVRAEGRASQLFFSRMVTTWEGYAR